MSHAKLYKQGKITQQEFENAEFLKREHPGIYKMYEERLKERAKGRDRDFRGHVERAERME